MAMQLQFFCPRWGSETIPFDVFCENVKEAGYDGVEMGLPLNEDEKGMILHTLESFNLQLIGQHYQTVASSLEEHLQIFAMHLYNLAAAKPLFINSQTGKDFFSFEENRAVIERANTIARETGVKIIHETHRGKFSFCTTSTKPFLDFFPDLRLTLDISHWCNVAESYLQDQQQMVEKAIHHTDHIHARIGFPEGPQINDPRAPEWQEALSHHLSWWDAIVALHQKKGSKVLTVTTEFGPAPYMPLLPFTRQPVSSQWEVNVYMKDLLKRRYNQE